MARAYDLRPAMTLWWVAALLALVLAALPAAAFAAPPTEPTSPEPIVTGIGKISMTWKASTDPDGDPVTYDVYRYHAPITSANLASATRVAQDLTATSVTDLAAHADEIAQSYVWFYAVVAKAGGESTLSKTASPNLHGYRTMSAIYSCLRCHSIHGTAPIDYKTVDMCYYCHGTEGSAAQPLGARSTLNIRSQFFDYDDQSAIREGGSQHRSVKMVEDTAECDACHTPHRSPYFYTNAGVYDAAQSYPRMLRVQTGVSATGKPTYTYYSQASSPNGIGFCLACHGPNAQPIGYVGDDGAFVSTAGDHTYAAGAAHGPANVFSNTDARALSADVQCLACHNKHASATGKLIDYRGSGTSDPNANAQAELCYKCHSAAGYAAEIAAGTSVGSVNFAWNARDVKAQFSKVSAHPTTLTSGTPTPSEHATFSHSAQAQFETYGLLNTMVTASGDGEITLYRPVNDPDPEPIIFGQRGSNTTFDQYTPRTNAWNDLYNPTNNTLWSPGTGSSAFVVNGQLYMTRGAGNNTQGSYNPATNAWGAVTNVANTVSTGGDSAVNTRNGLAYYLRAGSNSRVMWWQYSGTNTGQFDFRTGGTNRSLGIGASLAYAPTADRMFIIWGNNGAGDGRLYWRASPGNSNTSVDFSQGPQVIRNATGVYSRMTYFTKNGTEYLFVIGQDTSSNNDSMLIHTIDGTPVVRELNNNGPFNAALADGCDLEWDGGDYLYAIRGGSNAGFARIQIPSDPVNGVWGSWQSLTGPPWGTTWPIGSSIAVGIHDEPATYGDYAASGTATSVEILPYADAYNWGTVSWTENQPAGTSFTVTVQGWNGSAWQGLVSDRDISPIDLTAYGTGSITKLRLIGSFSTSSVSTSAELQDWTVTSVYDRIVVNNGSLTCANCHNVHSVGKGGTEVWDMARVSDPDNTKLTFSGTPTDFCLRCHDGAAPAAVTNESSLVPYSVGFSEFDAATAPFFPGWNKQAAGADWSSSGHANSRVTRMTPGCNNCHDPHASDQPRLTAATAVNTLGTPLHSIRRDGSSTYAEEKLCYLCHLEKRTSPPCANGACHPNIDTVAGLGMNVQTAFSGAYRHPVELTGRHSDTEGPADLGQANRHAECVDCHDPHATRGGKSVQGSSQAGNVLVGAWGVKPNYATPTFPDTGWGANNWTAAETYDEIRLTGQSTDFEAYLCLKCHSSYSGQPFQVTTASGTYTSTDVAKDFNPSNFSSHNVLGQSVGMKSTFTVGATTYNWVRPADSAFLLPGWTADSMMTCTDCHTNSTAAAKGPHGSSVAWILDPAYVNWTATSTVTRTGNGMSPTNIICAKCHTNLGTQNVANWVHYGHANWPDGGGNRCQMCHVKVPHGWKTPRMLGSNLAAGVTAVRAKNITNILTEWQEGDCRASCYSGHSGANPTPAWP